MPDREFIHSTSDVNSTLHYAFDSGFQVRLDEPQPEPRPCMLTKADIAKVASGVFFLFRPEWVYGPFEFMEISGGYNRGKYFMKPRVNYAPITVSFHGERIKDGRRKLGGAVVSCHADWLELPAKIVRPTPPEVNVWFKRIVKHLSSGSVIKVDVHRYHICKGVLADPEAAQCLPPFDFIPWGPDVLQAAKRTRTRKHN